MTYKEIKEQVFQLMFGCSVDGEDRMHARENKDALRALPGAANAAFRDLACSAAPIERALCAVLGEGETLPYETEQQSYPGGQGYDLFCEGGGGYRLCSRSAMEVREDWIDDDGTESAIGRYTVCEPGALVARALNGQRRVRVQLRPTDGDVRLPDIVFYAGHFAAPAALPLQGGLINVCALAKERGYHALAGLRPESPVYLNGEDITRFLSVPAPGLLYLPPCMRGMLTVHVRVMPAPVHENTPDEYTPELREEALSIAPYYIASRLFLEDDPKLANEYYRRYQQEKMHLPQPLWHQAGSAFESETGWV